MRNHRVTVIFIAICVALCGLILLLRKDPEPVDVKDSVTRVQAGSESRPVLNENVRKDVKEKVVGLQRRRDASGKLADGTRWTYRHAEAKDTETVIVDGYGLERRVTVDPDSGGGATLTFTAPNTMNADRLQQLAREQLTDKKLTVVQLKSSRGPATYKLGSGQLVAHTVTVKGRTATIEGLFARQSCVKVRGSKGAEMFALKLACELSVDTGSGRKSLPKLKPTPKGDY